MREVINAHIISHTHWDREWFLNSTYINEWLVPFFDSLFKLLDRERNYRFVLDGQTCIIEDYLNQLKKQGKDSRKHEMKLEQYIRKGQILVGPYYLQPDWQLVSGESLVRNLLIGHKIAEKYGQVMKVGWLLDNFGQISQAVQIHKKFDIKGLFLWRGVEMNPANINSEFLWESPDGSSLVAIYLLSSYRNAMRLGEFKEIIKERIENEVRKIYPFATTPNVLLMNGYDQEMIPDEFLPELEKLFYPDIQVKQSTPEEYIEAIKRNYPELKILKGVLYSGRFISVFPGTLSTRMYLKCMNDTGQRELEKYSEPFSILSWLNGGKYNYKVIMYCWKKLLRNHPRDSICGVSIDEVHTDMEKRLNKVINLSRKVTENRLYELVSNIDTSSGPEGAEPYIIFNSSVTVQQDRFISIKITEKNLKVTDRGGKIIPYEKGNYDTLHIYLDNIPALGYKTIYLKKMYSRYVAKQKNPFYVKLISKKNIVENQYLRIKINKNGSINVYDKNNGYEYKDLGIIADGADAGDEYNYSNPENDIVLSSENTQAKIEVIEKSSLKTVIRISLILQLPESLTENRKTRSSKLRDLPIITWITIEAKSSVVRFQTVIKNTIKDHRLRILFPTGISTDYSFAGSQFDVVKHKITPVPYDDTNIAEDVKRLILGAREVGQITTFPQRYFVDIHDGKRGIAVLNKGLPEYEILPDDTSIALTLFRAVGWLARGDLLTRIGDAGPTIFTTDAQCLRQMTFEYALYFHKGDFIQGEVFQVSDAFNTDLKIVKTYQNQGVLKDTAGFLNVKSNKNTLQVTAIKRAEDGDGIILRLFNPSEKVIEGKIISSYNLNCVYLVNLKEEIIEEVKDRNKNQFKLTVKPKEIVTIKLRIDRKNILKKMLKENQIKLQLLNQENYPEFNFSEFKSVPLITKDEIICEEKRLKEVEDKLINNLRKLSLVEDGVRKYEGDNPFDLAKLQYEFHKTKGEVKTYYRTVLEAQLSVLLSYKKYLEIYHKEIPTCIKSMEEIEKRLRKIGYDLNQARVSKRVYEYIVEYYQNRLKSISGIIRNTEKS